MHAKTTRTTARRSVFAGATLLFAGFAGTAFAADIAEPAPAPAPAVKAPVPFDVAFGFRWQSNYIFRGISQSNNNPSPQAYLELQFLDNLFYAGLAYERVDLVTKPSAEIDITAGIRPKWGPLTFDFGVIGYYYPNERRLINPWVETTYTTFSGFEFTGPTYYTPKNTDFLELKGTVSYNYADTLILGAGVYYAWDWLGSGSPGTYVNGTVKYNIPENALGFVPSGFAISGELGYYNFGRVSPYLGGAKLADYVTWNVGASYTFKNFTLDLRYYDTDLSKKDCFLDTTDPRGLANGTGQSKWCGAAFVATVSADFTLSSLGDLLPK